MAELPEQDGGDDVTLVDLGAGIAETLLMVQGAAGARVSCAGANKASGG